MDLDKLLDYIEKQQEKEITGIPLGFDRFNEMLPSIEKGQSYVVLGGSGIVI
jgi:replicative DNA helicase